jgi:hypothetical protein
MVFLDKLFGKQTKEEETMTNEKVVRTHPTLSLFTDFVNGSEFKPQDLHLDNVNAMLGEVEQWSKALKTVR